MSSQTPQQQQPPRPPSSSSLEEKYTAYIAALNHRPFPGLESHMHATVTLNEEPLARAEFEKLLTTDIDDAPDLRFHVAMLLVDEAQQRVAARIQFICTPTRREYMGREVRSPPGGKVKCMEHMFYQYREGKIETVWWVPSDLVPIEDGEVGGP